MVPHAVFVRRMLCIRHFCLSDSFLLKYNHFFGRFFVLCCKNEKQNEKPPREKIFTSLVCATQQIMPRKKKGEEHDKGTPNITQFFGLASPLQGISHSAPTSQASASPLAQRPVQRNLKLAQIEASSGARGGAARARQKSPNSESGEEELLYSGTYTFLCTCEGHAYHLHANR